jgi:nitroreductase
MDLPGIIRSMTAPLTNDELLTTTRTVRKRLDLTRDVPMDLVRECLDIALQAPSGSNRQGWHWIVVTEAAKRAAIGEVYRRATEKYLDSGRSAGSLHQDDPDRARQQQRVGDSAAWLGRHMGEVPVHVLACIEAPQLSGGNQAGLWGSLLPAAWSYALAARARGLGTAWTTLHLTDEAEVARVLGIPDGVRQGVLLPTAYYTGETFRPAKRQPLDEVLHVNGW